MKQSTRGELSHDFVIGIYNACGACGHKITSLIESIQS